MLCRAALASLLCVALVASAQTSGGRTYRVALLGVPSQASYQRQVDALRAGLRDLGYVEGRNLVIDERWADGDPARLSPLAAELVAKSPDVIVTSGPGTAAAKTATRTIPIVMSAAGDAVATGLVDTLARPGGNVTGFSFLFPEINAKRVAILKEALPQLSRLGVIFNPQGTATPATLAAMREAASALGIVLHAVEVRSMQDLDAALNDIVRSRGQALVVADHTVFVANAARIARATSERKLPSIGFVELADAGGTFAYGVDFPALWGGAAVYIDKILKGARPADLPVQQPTRFELVVNLGAARILGLPVARTLVERADRLLR